MLGRGFEENQVLFQRDSDPSQEVTPMKCLRCGYCCIHYEVAVIKDSSLPLSEDNIMHKHSGMRCPHLLGEKPGDYACAVHDHPDYASTPCADFTQIEHSPEDNCRMGDYVLHQVTLKEKS